MNAHRNVLFRNETFFGHYNLQSEDQLSHPDMQRRCTCKYVLKDFFWLTESRTTDRAGRARAPTHAHPDFDDKL